MFRIIGTGCSSNLTFSWRSRSNLDNISTIDFRKRRSLKKGSCAIPEFSWKSAKSVTKNTAFFCSLTSILLLTNMCCKTGEVARCQPILCPYFEVTNCHYLQHCTAIFWMEFLLTIYIISDQRWYSIQCFCSFFCRCGITHLHQPRQSSVTKDLAKGEAVSIRTAKCLNVTSGHTAHLEAESDDQNSKVLSMERHHCDLSRNTGGKQLLVRNLPITLLLIKILKRESIHNCKSKCHTG